MKRVTRPAASQPIDGAEASSAAVVGLALANHLDNHAYTAGFRGEQGLVARPHHAASRRPSVVVSDRCRLRLEGIGPADGMPVVVLLRDGAVTCECCHAVAIDSPWRELADTVRGLAGLGPVEPDPITRLTRRERQVLALVGEGRSVRQAAEQLGVSPSTVGNHKHRLMRKLGVRSSLALVRLAVRHGLTEV